MAERNRPVPADIPVRVPRPRSSADDAPPAWSIPAYLRLARQVGLGVREAVGGLARTRGPRPARRPGGTPDLRGAAIRLMLPGGSGAGGTHPAYPAILEQLTPDEARILTHLLGWGPVPAVDVVTGGPVGRVLPAPLARCLTELDLDVELGQPCLLPQALTNLFRLGLVWHSTEPVGGAGAYRSLESRACVRAVLRSARLARVVRRSLHLTPLGEDFTRACFGEGAG